MSDNWKTLKGEPTISPVVDAQGVKRLIMFSGLYPIRMAVSEDNGETWTPLKPIGGFGGIVAMADLVRLKDGCYMAFFHDDGCFILEEGERGPFKVYKTLSRDGGLTWSEPEVVYRASLRASVRTRPCTLTRWQPVSHRVSENSRKLNSYKISVALWRLKQAVLVQPLDSQL